MTLDLNCDAFLSHQFVCELSSLGLNPCDYVIAGSGPLFVRGWIDDPGDIDVVARGGAWDRAKDLADPRPSRRGDAQQVTLFGGHIQILNRWIPQFGSVDFLIGKSDFICGLDSLI